MGLWSTIKAVICLLISGIILSFVGLIPIALISFAAIPLTIIGYIASLGSIPAVILGIAVFFLELYLILNLYFDKVGFLSTISHVFFIIFGISLIVKLWRNFF